MAKSKPNIKKEVKTREEKKPKMGAVAIKHTRVLNNLQKNLGKTGKSTMTKAMIDAGYSESYAKNGDIIKNKTFQQLLEQHLPDSLLTKTHEELLNAKKIEYMLFDTEIKDEEIYELVGLAGGIVKLISHGMRGTHVYFFMKDNKTVKDATDMGYKVKTKYAIDKMAENLNNSIQSMSDADLMAERKALLSRFKKTD